MNKAQNFLKSHKMTAADINMQELVGIFLDEMEKGLEGKESTLRMIPTYIETEGELVANQPVIAIDAGGTNFRTAIVYFDDNMNLITEKLENGRMPGVEKELGKKEFFREMAGYLEDYIDKSDNIGFCFSYATEISPNKDGKLLEWSKELKAPEVIGEMIGENLLAALGTPGKKLVLMNDTVSTLLAGKAATAGKEYETYIGFILGTGTNTSYTEPNKNITKTSGLDPDKSQIINIESGNFGKGPCTNIDTAFDNTTKNPGRYTFEKMFSGGYFGGLCTFTLKQAAKEGIFRKETASAINRLPELSSEEVNKFVCGIDADGSSLKHAFSTEEDKNTGIGIIEGLIERASKLVAANLAAVILRTGKAQSADKPVLMTIEGTTFYKLKNFREMFETYLTQFLSGENQRYYDIVEVPNSSLVGAAIAAIVN